MRTDHLIRVEDKFVKAKRIEENRQRYWRKMNDRNNQLIIPMLIESYESILSDIDRACLLHIEKSYLYIIELIPSASCVISFEPSIYKTLSFSLITNIDQYDVLKLIQFLRLIPEFESLNEQDRLLLVKYNILQLLTLRDILLYDYKNDLLYDDKTKDSTPEIREQFAHSYKSLCILLYDYEQTRAIFMNLRFIFNSIDNDPLIIQLLMLIIIFEKGLTNNSQHILTLSDPQRIFHIHLKYIDLLFRYLIHRYSNATFNYIYISCSNNYISLSRNTYTKR